MYNTTRSFSHNAINIHLTDGAYKHIIFCPLNSKYCSQIKIKHSTNLVVRNLAPPAPAQPCTSVQCRGSTCSII